MSYNTFRKPWYKKKSSDSIRTPNLNPPCSPSEVIGGYFGFSLYFPDEFSADVEKIKQNAKCFEGYISRNYPSNSLLQFYEDKHFNVDYKDVTSEEELTTKWVNFKEEITTNTEYCLSCMGLAMHQFITIKEYGEMQNNEKIDVLPIIRARLTNFQPIVQIKDIKGNLLGKLVAVRGTVVKASSTKIICRYLAFSCSVCDGTQVVQQINEAYTLPSKCQTQGCRVQSNFVPEHTSQFTKTLTWQGVKIQEFLEEEETARIPRTLDCELTEDLVKSCVPGDDITITGVVKVRDPNDNKGKNKQNSVFTLYLDAVSLCNNKKLTDGTHGGTERITFNTNDYREIQEIHSKPDLFRLLVHSLCPSIYGHEIVKAGLLLALLGGTKNNITRSECHVLMMGDPGLGKSQMLRACSNVAPKGVYVCGNTSTSTGLTVTMARESAGEYTLEAGALILADRGCCCIDEFDKMPSQHACLLEAMEQQSISIAKAGMICSLPTRATILAAANPVGGHYNKSKTISENLKISSPMLSRFDLIFILLDQQNEQWDMLLSKHVLAMHSGVKSDLDVSVLENSYADNSLRERLKQTEGLQPLSHNYLRKYLAYAQRFVHPYLSEGAKTVLKRFYIGLRKQFLTGDCTPVTARQLNSLIRLTQARAKAELREEATTEDALDIVDIMKHSLIDVFTDESGAMDKTRSQHGTGMSRKNKVMALLQILKRKSEVETKSLFTVQEIKDACEQVGIPKEKFYSTFETLNIQGFLLNKGQSKYELVCADL